MKKILLFTCLLLSLQQSIAQTIRWQNNANAAICLTYDDGMETHLSHVIPQLDSIGLRGTFFLNAIQGSFAITTWKKAARRGHELANHSLFHPCSRTIGWAEDIAIENYTLERLLTEVRTMDAILSQLDSSRRFRTYGYPCNHHAVGNGQDYSEALAKTGLVKYARTGGDKNSIITNVSSLNPMKMPAFVVEEGMSADSLIAYVERVKAVGGLGILQFHGIGGQWISVTDATHIRLLQYLKQHEKEIWVAPFGEVMQFLKP
jgi:peptidoglycan-N-acetylglucosamine deacetylase